MHDGDEPDFIAHLPNADVCPAKTVVRLIPEGANKQPRNRFDEIAVKPSLFAPFRDSHG